MTYADFLLSKRPIVPDLGFRVEPKDLNPRLFPWQADVVGWALARGRAALFEDTGLGKTAQQLEWANHVVEETGRPVLVLTPLAVAPQTVLEGAKFGVEVAHCRGPEDLTGGVNVANYQRLELFDPSIFGGVVLDESSILKSFGGKTRWKLNYAFEETPYRLCCTATPAPNDYVELGTHSKFLGLMDVGEMLTRWFINDTKKMRTTRLKRHGEADFWRWVASWAVCVSKPSDLLDATGRPYPDDGYDLPPLNVVEHRVPVDHRATQEQSGELFRSADPLSATDLHREMRLTARVRAERAAELVRVGAGAGPWVVWCNTDYEADEIRRAFKRLEIGIVEIRGSEPLERKEAKLAAFSRGEISVLVTKPRIAGFGLNWQHCSRMAFVGLSYSYEQLYQALRRSWRFGQPRPVEAHLITAETEDSVMATIKRKREDHEKMKQKMVGAMRESGIHASGEDLRAGVGEASVRVSGAEDGSWKLRQGDCVEVSREIPDDSVHLSVFSPPFSSLYSYSPSLRDMGNCADDEEFFEHFSHLIPELLRATVPGRLCVVHTKDMPRAANRYGYGGLRDFTGEVTRAFEDCVQPDGTRWAYHSKVTIWTDPVREMQRTKRTALLYKTLKRDASYSAVGCPEYLTVFRKWTPEAGSPEPVEHKPGTPEEIPLEVWRRYASPVWMDVQRTDVLNTRVAREDADEKHLAPLQLGVVRRCVELWSNPGDLVLDPFAGLGSVGYEALGLGRRFLGVELKGSYFEQATRILSAVEEGEAQPDLLDALGVTGG